MNNTEATTDNNDLVVRPYDILCGRSKTCFNNIGNRRFRITISMNLRKFDSLPTRTERGKFIATLASTLKDDAGFRFIRISKKHGGRVELSDEEIRAKIGHALRDLSKAQAEAAAAVIKPTEEAKKVFGANSSSISKMTSSSSSRATTPIPQQQQQQQQAQPSSSSSSIITKKPSPIVTPQVPQRQLISDTIRKEDFIMATTTTSHYNEEDDISDISQDDHAVDHQHATSNYHVAQHHHHHHLPTRRVMEDHHVDMKMPPLLPTVTQQQQQHHVEPHHRKPAPFINSHHPSEDLGDDDYCLMPLRFDESPSGGMLDPVPMDLFDNMSTNHSTRPTVAAATFDLNTNDIMEDDDNLDLPYAEFERRCSLH